MAQKRIDRKRVASSYKKLGRIQAVAEELNICKKSVSDILKELNIQTTPRNERNRKYKINESFFKKINTSEKAYILGFLWGDGNLQNKKGNHQIRIEIASKDRAILEDMRKAMSSNHPITDRIRDRLGTETKSSTLAIGRRDMVEDLMRLGMPEIKNSSLEIPKIKKVLTSHFIRGFSDSDGSIRIDKENRASWSIITTTSLCCSVQDILKQNNVVSRVIPTIYKHLSRVIITKKSEIIKLRSYLYTGNHLCLNRKKMLFFNVYYKRREV